MGMSADIITSSIAPASYGKRRKRIDTMLIRNVRFTHAEFMTHRVFSRNASSSRAIPVQRQIDELIRDPAMPVFWGSNKPGMQAGDELTGEALDRVKKLWLAGRDLSIATAQEMVKEGLHKQISNRILEPWAHINLVVTATDWANFFGLRCHPDAQPEIRHLAELMYRAYENEVPKELQPGEWHLPFIKAQDWDEADRFLAKLNSDNCSWSQNHGWTIDRLLQDVSAARCARTSYRTFEGKISTIEEDTDLCRKLGAGDVIHASPFEHQATPDVYKPMWELAVKVFGPRAEGMVWEHPELHGNLSGWVQNRKTLANENIKEFRAIAA